MHQISRWFCAAICGICLELLFQWCNCHCWFYLLVISPFHKWIPLRWMFVITILWLMWDFTSMHLNEIKGLFNPIFLISHWIQGLNVDCCRQILNRIECWQFCISFWRRNCCWISYVFDRSMVSQKILIFLLNIRNLSSLFLISCSLISCSNISFLIKSIISFRLPWRWMILSFLISLYQSIDMIIHCWFAVSISWTMNFSSLRFVLFYSFIYTLLLLLLTLVNFQIIRNVFIIKWQF